MSQGHATAQLSVPHMFWECVAQGDTEKVKAPIDHGCHTVLIHESYATCLGLYCCSFPKPESIEISRPPWTAHTVHAIVTPGLCAPVILGLPFMSHNEIVVNTKE